MEEKKKSNMMIKGQLHPYPRIWASNNSNKGTPSLALPNSKSHIQNG